MSYFHSLEVVGRGSETQIQVGENIIKITRQANVYVVAPLAAEGYSELLWEPLTSTM